MAAKGTTLTEKEEAYCQAYLLNGGNKSEAYRTAYNTQKMKPATINVKACQLHGKDKIAVRISELQAEVRKGFNISAEQKKRWLQEVIQASLERKMDNEGNPTGMRDSKAVIAAIAELNKMDGDYAAQKVDLNATVSQADRVKALKAKLASKRA